MAVSQLISEEEYLHTTFEHDAEYVDGRIVERPMPKKRHSKMQRFLILQLCQVTAALGFEVWPEQRIRTVAEPTRYRIPDICVTRGEPEEEVFTTPPFLCIEILSPDENPIELRAKIREYLALGVEYIWEVDPKAKSGEIHTKNGIERSRGGKFKAGPIEIDLAGME